MKEIYFAAQSLSGEAQARYLKDRCPDESLRKEIERLLAESTEDSTNVTLDSLVPPSPSTELGVALGPGSMLGHYRIKRKLGVGGMSWVFEANDEKLLRTVAIKVLPPGRDDEPTRRRLMREARSASALNHPNIVTVYEAARYGETDLIAMKAYMERPYARLLATPVWIARPHCDTPCRSPARWRPRMRRASSTAT